MYTEIVEMGENQKRRYRTFYGRSGAATTG